jgi:hypothetical protein
MLNYKVKLERMLNNSSNWIDVSFLLAKCESILIEDDFDQELSISRMDIKFYKNINFSTALQHREKWRATIWYLELPDDKFVSEVFYLDFADIQDNDTQYFILSLTAANPDLGFTYGVSNEIVYTNKTIKQAAIDFAAQFNLTSELDDLTPNISLGYLNPNNLNDSPKITFKSYGDMLRHIAKNHGFFVNISGSKLSFRKIESGSAYDKYCSVPEYYNLLSFDSKQNYTNLYKRYYCVYKKTDGSLVNDFYDNPNIFVNKSIQLDNYYLNSATAIDVLSGALYRNFYENFSNIFVCTGFNDLKAGYLLIPGTSYNQHDVTHRITKVVHKIDNRGWICEVHGFPIAKIKQTTPSLLVNPGILVVV